MCVREREEKIKENGNCKGIFFFNQKSGGGDAQLCTIKNLYKYNVCLSM